MGLADNTEYQETGNSVPTPAGKETWEEYLAGFMENPQNAALVQQYGLGLTSILYDGWAQDWEDERILNEVRSFLAGAGGPSSNGNGSGSGYYGGGGGGGMSTAQQKDQAIASITNEAASMGLTLDAATIAGIAGEAIKNKWNGDQLTDHLVAIATYVGFSNLQNQGSLQSSFAAIQEEAARYLVRLSDESAQEYALRIQSGELTYEGVLNVIRAQAKDRYAWAADLIDQGITTRDLALPLRDALAEMWEVAPNTLDLMDRDTLKLLEARNEDGTKRLVNTEELMLRARQDERFESTGQAVNELTAVGSMLSDLFSGVQ